MKTSIENLCSLLVVHNQLQTRELSKFMRNLNNKLLAEINPSLLIHSLWSKLNHNFPRVQKAARKLPLITYSKMGKPIFRFILMQESTRTTWKESRTYWNWKQRWMKSESSLKRRSRSIWILEMQNMQWRNHSKRWYLEWNKGKWSIKQSGSGINRISTATLNWKILFTLN